MQRLPNPPMVPDRMVNATGDRLSMSAPGSTPIVDPPSMTSDLSDLAANGGAASSSVPVSTERPRDGSGKFTEDTSAWSQAGSDAAGWKVC